MSRAALLLVGTVLWSTELAWAEDSELFLQAQAAAGRGRSVDAVRLATRLIERNPKYAEAFYLRGRERFRLGEVDKSVDDFDHYVKLKPRVAPQQWERGIAYYYAKRYKQGAEQFELYQTYLDNDVENSVWRFLCMVPIVGVEKARDVMLPIKNDRRPGMMQVYELYRGRMEPDQVLAAAQAGEPNPQQLAGRLFYIHLYLGLYNEALGKKVQAETYIRLAADRSLAENPRINRYMWDVARVHLARVYGKVKPDSRKKTDSKKSN